MEEKSELLKQRGLQLVQLNELNTRLSNTKFPNKKRVKQAIANVEQSLDKIDKRLKVIEVTERQNDRNEMREVGFQHGIDTRGDQFKSGADSISSISNAVVAGFTGKSTLETVYDEKGNAVLREKKQPNYLLFGGVALILFFLLNKKS